MVDSTKRRLPLDRLAFVEIGPRRLRIQNAAIPGSFCRIPDRKEMPRQMLMDDETVIAIYTHDPRNRRAYLQGKAHRAVNVAVLKGELPNLRESYMKCSDCDSRAIDWDHRDYTKPLAVEAVCRPCNIKRGPARVS